MSDQPQTPPPAKPLAPATGSASEDWQITALTPWGYFEMDCNSGRTRRVSHDWGYKLNVEPPNRELSHG